MNTYFAKIGPAQIVGGFVLAFLGLATLFAPDESILTPAHLQFFGTIPREVWGPVQLVVAAWVLIRPLDFRALWVAGLVAFAWGCVALYPAFSDKPWNIISVGIWFGSAVGLFVEGARNLRRA